MERLQKVLERYGFNTSLLDELQENGEVKLSMQFEKTPILMQAINEETDYQAVLSDDTNNIIISKY